MPFARNWLPAAVVFLNTLLCYCLMTGCGVSVAGPTAITSVAPLATDDLSAPCRYDLLLLNPVEKVTGLLVIFDRSDTIDLYNDPTVRATADALGYGIIFAHECDSTSTGDLQADATKGPARALLLALQQLAMAANHPEIANANMVLYGFSAGGVLTATMANQIPDRLIGAVEYAAGSLYLDLNDITITPSAAKIPTLILANAKDEQSGTFRIYHYFLRGKALGNPPWAYAVQNDTGHCCNLSTRSVVLPWLRAVAAHPPVIPTAGGQTNAGSATLYNHGTLTQFACTPDGTQDAVGDIDCSFTAASLQPVAGSSSQTAWLPDQASASAWLTWVTNPSTN